MVLTIAFGVCLVIDDKLRSIKECVVEIVVDPCRGYEQCGKVKLLALDVEIDLVLARVGVEVHTGSGMFHNGWVLDVGDDYGGFFLFERSCVGAR